MKYGICYVENGIEKWLENEQNGKVILYDNKEDADMFAHYMNTQQDYHGQKNKYKVKEYQK